MNISGKNAVVTGAAGGIGRGIALALAQAGANVIVADIEGAKARATAEEVAAIGVKSGAFEIDVRDSEQMARLADYAWETLDSVEILCNNAGVVATGAGLDVTDADFRWQLEVNVIGVFNGVREFTRRFIEQGGEAHIVNTGSHNSIGAPVAGVAPYVACKHAILGLTEAFRTEYGDKVKYSLLCPGIINTGIWDAGRNRPEEFGGSFKGHERNHQAVETFGMRPERVGQLVAQGIQNEDFFIWTHPQDLELIEKRYRESKNAMLRQWPDGPGEEHHESTHDVS